MQYSNTHSTGGGRTYSEGDGSVRGRVAFTVSPYLLCAPRSHVRDTDDHSWPSSKAVQHDSIATAVIFAGQLKLAAAAPPSLSSEVYDVHAQ